MASLPALWHLCLRRSPLSALQCFFSATALSILCIAALLSASMSVSLSALSSAASFSVLLLSAPSTSAFLGWGGESALSCVFVGGEDGVISPQHGRW